MEANQEALPDPDNEDYDGSSGNSSMTRSIERISLDLNVIQNQNISTNLENINRNQENLSRRFDRLAENQENVSRRLDGLSENVCSLGENYDNLNTSFLENRANIKKMKDNFKKMYGTKNGFD